MGGQIPNCSKQPQPKRGHEIDLGPFVGKITGSPTKPFLHDSRTQETAKYLHLPSSHGLGHEPLESKLLLLEVIGGGVLNLELAHSVTESGLNLLLVAALQFHGHGGVRNELLNTRDVGLELLARFELLGESFIARLELGGICEALVTSVPTDR